MSDAAAAAPQDHDPTLSALGHKQTQRHRAAMSALPPKADIERHDRNVCFVPQADITLTSSIARG